MTAQHSDRAAADRHRPVLLDRCVELLEPALAEPDAVFVDCTLGMGGHTEAVLTRFPHVRAIGIDRDTDAIELASERLAQFADRFTAVHAVYDEILPVLAELDVHSVQGVLMDLGVSSLQIDEVERGFSYAQDAPLDMRMDSSEGLTAADVLNTYPETDLVRILRDFGEERFAPRIARAIVRRRETAAWDRSADLVDLVRACVPAATRKPGTNPAKRTFQALRIEVNGELEALTRAVPSAIESLAIDGRIVIESYHSLEDRLVKRAVATGVNSSAPEGLPVEPATHRPYLKLLTRGAEEANATELEQNPRSASVRLRAAVRTRLTPQHVLRNLPVVNK